MHFFINKDINECLVSFPCTTGQLCVNTEGSYVCMCLNGTMMNVEGACVKGMHEFSLSYII